MDKKDYRKSYIHFEERNKNFEKQYGKQYFEKQHKKGKLTARERVHFLLDEGTFEEIDAFVVPEQSGSKFGKISKQYGDGVIAGHGKINGRLVFLYAQDFAVMGGSLGQVHAQKIAKIQDMAIKMGAPIIGLIDSGGARIQEGIASLAGYAKIFKRNVKASGVIPQISVILGPAAGGAVYSPALTDFVFMARNTSYMFVTGPDVVREVLSEEVTHENLGGANVHAQKTGVAQFAYNDEEHALLGVKKLLNYLPSNNVAAPPKSTVPDIEPENPEKLRKIIPDDANKPYDIKEVINLIVDKNSLFEISEHFAPNIFIGLARLNGEVIGIVANQPKILAGVLDINSSVKASRFVRFCDSFNIPILTLEDVPGFLPGTEQEHMGIIKHGAKLLYAYAEATVPKITVILRKAYGGAYIVMNSKNMGGDFNFAWPTAEVAVMGPEGAVSILYRKELADADDPKKLKKQLAQKYRDEVANPYVADERGYIDEVIDPIHTRKKLIIVFEALKNKYSEVISKKHGNMPL